MTRNTSWLDTNTPLVVGSMGSLEDFQCLRPETIKNSCDWLEIRLDLLPASDSTWNPLWQAYTSTPILLTARRADEGGQRCLSASERQELLINHLPYADGVDIELASIVEMQDTIQLLHQRKIPWLASFHDFNQTPDLEVLTQAAARAKAAGASMFKVAAMIQTPDDLSTLAHFQQQNHDIVTSSMGMGPLAPVSRLLCAQYGSRFNYGFMGKTPTAPGQWSAHTLKTAITSLTML